MKRFRKKIRSLLLKWVAKHFGYEIVNQWVYFGYNYSSSDKMIRDCWGDFNERCSQAQHFYNKFDSMYERYGSNAVMNRFWVELSPDHRKRLYKFFLKDYGNEHF